MFPVRPAALVLSTAIGVAACAGQPDDRSITPHYDPKTGKLTKLEWDRDRDGRVDAWARMDGTRLLKIDVDTDGDGRPERWEYHDGTTTMTRAEEDGDRDGAVDRWETWTNGRLAVTALDTAHLGRPDRRIVYGPDGAERLEVDPDGDGAFVPAGPPRGRR